MFLHNLTGNTQVTKNVRQMMPNVDPQNLAVWTLPNLYPRYESFFELYDSMPHRELLMTPLQAWDRSIATFGTRPSRHINYSDKFLLATCPTTDKGTAKVTPAGVKINYFLYNSDVLFPLIGKQVLVKYEPYDLSVAWAYVNRVWVRLSSRFHRTVRGLTERELHMLTEEYRQRRGQVEFQRLNDRKLILFLREVENEEKFQLERKRAQELQRVLGTIGAPLPLTPGTTKDGGADPAQHDGTPEPIAAETDNEFSLDLAGFTLTELDTY
jgi:putative transposase